MGLLAKPLPPPPEHSNGNYMNDQQLSAYLTDLRVSSATVKRNFSNRAVSIGSQPQRAGSGTHGRNVCFGADMADSMMPPPLRLHNSGQPRQEINASLIPGNLSTSPSIIHLEDERWLEKEEARNLRLTLADLGISDDQYPIPAGQQGAGASGSHETAEVPPPQVQAPRRKKSYQALASAVASDIASIKRRVSSGGRRKASSDRKMFPNVEDRIYEEPEPIKEEETTVPTIIMPPVAPPQPDSEEPRHVRKNPFARVRLDKVNLERANSLASTRSTKSDAVNLHHQPSQARKPWYTSNQPVGGAGNGRIKPQQVRTEGMGASTILRRDDNDSLPPQAAAASEAMQHTPVVPTFSVSRPQETQPRSRIARPSRPANTSAPSEPTPRLAHKRSIFDRIGRERVAAGRSAPPFQSSTSIPILNLPDDGDGTKSKVLSEEPAIAQKDLFVSRTAPQRMHPAHRDTVHGRDLPPVVESASNSMPEQPRSRPLPDPMRRAQAAAPVTNGRHPLSAVPLAKPPQTRNASLCAQCALPIAGRILTAAGDRFHPECFACHHCGINLECVAFYPEPAQKHYERIARIQQRMQGFELAVPGGVTAEDMQRLEEADGDEGLRFFCHLDFHETFSPRCRSCKTPIEGEVVVACGAEWHVGHFFCAQCGDPFDSSTPFVEKDGYAWCLGCHSNRYSAKCRKCKKPVTDLVVNAIGFEWHGECFCCCECGGEFADGKYFLRGESSDPVCVRCETRRLKA